MNLLWYFLYFQFAYLPQVFGKLKSGKSEKGFAAVVSKNANVNVVSTVHATHSFSDEEKASFADYINDVLKDDADLKHLKLPMDPESDQLFKGVRDGILLKYWLSFLNLLFTAS
jgi:hypothetical protein